MFTRSFSDECRRDSHRHTQSSVLSASNRQSRAQIDLPQCGFRQEGAGCASFDLDRSFDVKLAGSLHAPIIWHQGTYLFHCRCHRTGHTGGNIVGVADVSGSMTTPTLEVMHQPSDRSSQLVWCHLSRVLLVSHASGPGLYRTSPRSSRSRLVTPLNVRERIQSTMNRTLAAHDFNGHAQGADPPARQTTSFMMSQPVIHVASDMNFDQCDKSVAAQSTYSNSTGRYETPSGARSPSAVEEYPSDRRGDVDSGGPSVFHLMVFHNINVDQSGVEATRELRGHPTYRSTLSR